MKYYIILHYRSCQSRPSPKALYNSCIRLVWSKVHYIITSIKLHVFGNNTTFTKMSPSYLTRPISLPRPVSLSLSLSLPELCLQGDTKSHQSPFMILDKVEWDHWLYMYTHTHHKRERWWKVISKQGLVFPSQFSQLNDYTGSSCSRLHSPRTNSRQLQYGSLHSYIVTHS